MEEQIFRKQLEALTQLAKKQGMCLSEVQITESFPELSNNTEQMGFLLEYFKNKKISVGDKDEVEDFLSMEDKNYLDQYLEGLKDIEIIDSETLKDIILSATAGDEQACSLVLSQFLDKTVNLAKLYVGQGVQLEDLIGEGNLALAEGISNLGCIDTDGDILEEAEGFLGKYMMDAMERMINGELDEKNLDEKVLEKVNRVADVAKELYDDLRRKVSPEEVCANSELTLDDVQYAMSISANLIDTIEMEYKGDTNDE